MRCKLLMILGCTVALTAWNSQAYAANKSAVSGRVVNTQNQPLGAIAVTIEGTTAGIYTNKNGEFRIANTPTGSQTVVVSGLGIGTIKIPADIVAQKETSLGDIKAEIKVMDLKEIVVMGKSEARRIQEQAYAISVVDVGKHYNSAVPLSKLLNNVSSVRVREDGGMGSDYNFSLNGFSGNQIKFFLDGVPMDNFGSSFSINDISANMTERVEVYKGVLPVSLGADALGGAVNIISRKSANYIDASYSFGSFNTHKASVNGAYTDSKSGFTLRANAFYNYSDNDYKVFAPIVDLATNKVVDQRWVKRFNDNYTSAGLRLETGITNKPYADYLLAGVIISGNDNNLQTGATMDAVYGGVKTRSKSFIPSILYKKDDLFTQGLSLSLYGSYSEVSQVNIDTLALRYNWLGDYIPSASAGERYLTDATIKNNEWLGNATINYVIGNHQSISVNHMVSSINRETSDRARPDDPMNNIDQKLTKNITGLGWLINYNRWNANLFAKLYDLHSSTYKRLDEYTENARWERVSDKKNNIGYGAAATYHILKSLQAKVSYEHAYRMPENIEMFGDGLIQQRNPDLRPESSRNLNIGMNFNKANNVHAFSAEANFVYRDTRDFILKGVSLTSNPTTGYENLGKVLTKGLEAGFRYSYKRWLRVGGNATYQDITDNQQFEKNDNSFVGDGITENITYGERLPNIPYLFANADIGVSFKNIGMKNTILTLDYHLNYVHKYYLSFPGLGAKASKKVIPEQLSHDLSVGYSLQNGKYSILMECANFTNQKLFDNYRLQKPGRAFNIKLRYFLGKK